MTARKILTLLLLCLSVPSLFAQGVQSKIQYLGDGAWGVFVKPVDIAPTAFTTIGSGQMTIVTPAGFMVDSTISSAGVWTLDAPVYTLMENPTKNYLRFGYNGNTKDVPLAAGEETLLFTIYSGGNCPDTLNMIDCNSVSGETDTMCYMNSTSSNFGCEMSIYDFRNNTFFGWQGNYAHSAWNCHGSDEEDTPFVKTKLQYSEPTESWGVFIKPQDGFQPAALTQLLSGRITIAGSGNFLPDDLTSQAAGDWLPGATLIDAPENPGMNYFTFNLEANGSALNLQAGEETMLFSFKNGLGLCPDSLYPIKDFKPAGVEANELSGLSIGGAQEEAFSLGEIYAPKAWRCESIFIVTIDRDNGGGNIYQKPAAAKTPALALSPNPAGDFVKVELTGELAENQSFVKIYNLHGQPFQQHLATGQNTLQLDLTGLPVGLYFLILESEGKVLHRERFVKE